MKETVFSASDILLPYNDPKAAPYEKWAVIACDQFTSEPAYWDETERIIGGAPSAYDYILPEAYLGTAREEERLEQLKRTMSSFDSTRFERTLHGFVAVERTLSNGRTRFGILGQIDLESYDYLPSSCSSVRATEQTVLERIPPRRALRAVAAVELPHIMIFADDKASLFETARSLTRCESKLYDFELMQGGGHIKGYAITGADAERLSAAVLENERLSPLPYAVGDGNHSLAAAKSHYEQLRRTIGDAAALKHPARYALCEIVSIDDSAIEFEPIHRIVKGVCVPKLLSELEKLTCSESGEQCITVITADGEKRLFFTEETHAMTVGTLQNFIDRYLESNDGVCDYIHGEDALRALARERDSVAFMFEGFDKSKLFSYIKDGPLPRKTFSMGDAHSKRYYLESRVITL